MPWRTVEDLSAGLELLCDEHDAQYCLVAAAQNAVTRELDPAVTHGLLAMVLHSAQTHSVSEERLMQLYDFPDYESHVRMHDELVTKVEAIVDAHRSGRRNLAIDRLNAFAEALHGHIGVDDAVFHRHLLERVPDLAPN